MHIQKKEVKLINLDCLPILMLLYIILYIMHAYIVLFAALSNAVCLHNVFFFLSSFAIDFCKCFLFSCFVLVHMSLTCCIKSHCTPATLAPAHTPCLFSIDLHTVRQHLVIVHFLLLLLLSGTLFQMMSGVPHHSHHLSLV